MDSKLLVEPPQPTLNFFTLNDTPLVFPGVFGGRNAVTVPLWLVLTGDVINLAASYNLSTGANAGWTTLRTEKKVAGSMNGAKFAFLAGRRKPGAATALMDNLVTLKVNAVEVARISVSEETQRVGWSAFAIPTGEVYDTRFMTPAGAAGDFAFLLSTADPALELQFIVGGGI